VDVAGTTERRLLVTASDEIHLKSKRTRRRFMRILRQNLEQALQSRGIDARLWDGPPGRISVATVDPAALEHAAVALAAVFGVHRVDVMRLVDVGSLNELVDAAGALFTPLVAGHKFAVRVRRRGQQDWRSADAEREIGSRLLAASAGVDLDHPDVTAHLEVWDDHAYLAEERFPGAAGLPLGTQPPLLALLSGGFDSPVAAWLMMRRGSPVDFLHATMDCAQSEHALAVAYELWHRWGAGARPRVWVVEFRDVKEALLANVDSGHRQVALKQLMLQVASLLARREGYPALVTGESIGQVSTQTVVNLAEIDRAHDATVFRPLSGFTKDEIVSWSRRIGTHDLSARAREVCDLSTSGPVETAVRHGRLMREIAQLPVDLAERALASAVVVDLPDWYPGAEVPRPVVPAYNSIQEM